MKKEGTILQGASRKLYLALITLVCCLITARNAYADTQCWSCNSSGSCTKVGANDPSATLCTENTTTSKSSGTLAGGSQLATNSANGADSSDSSNRTNTNDNSKVCSLLFVHHELCPPCESIKKWVYYAVNYARQWFVINYYEPKMDTCMAQNGSLIPCFPFQIPANIADVFRLKGDDSKVYQIPFVLGIVIDKYNNGKYFWDSRSPNSLASKTAVPTSYPNGLLQALYANCPRKPQ